VNKLKGLKPYFSTDPYEALIKGIVRQIVRASIARSSISALVTKYGIKMTFDGKTFYSFPSPYDISKLSKYQLLECNVGYKWELIKKLSSDVVSGDLDIDSFKNLSDDQIIEILTEYKGIGYWTSRIFLFDGLKKINSYPIRDMSLKKAVSLLHYNKKSISWNEVELFFDNYQEYIGLATTYLFGIIWLENNLIQN